MRNGEPQPLPGILEDLPPLPMPLPQEELYAVGEALTHFKEVTLPDWLDSKPDPADIKVMYLYIDYWNLLVGTMGRIVLTQAL